MRFHFQNYATRESARRRSAEVPTIAKVQSSSKVVLEGVRLGLAWERSTDLGRELLEKTVRCTWYWVHTAKSRREQISLNRKLCLVESVGHRRESGEDRAQGMQVVRERAQSAPTRLRCTRNLENGVPRRNQRHRGKGQTAGPGGKRPKRGEMCLPRAGRQAGDTQTGATELETEAPSGPEKKQGGYRPDSMLGWQDQSRRRKNE